MLVYIATYPRCGSGVLRNLIGMNLGPRVNSVWDEQPGDRAALAADAAVHCAKTHAPPVEAPLPGERAIQLVRHPGAALASHYRLYRATNGGERPLKRFIAGQRATGDWTGYHRAWEQTAMPLLRLRFEAVTEDPAAALAQIAAFIGLPAPAEPRIETAAHAHARNPVRNPLAAADAWRELFVGKELQRLREAHGALAAELGYEL